MGAGSRGIVLLLLACILLGRGSAQQPSEGTTKNATPGDPTLFEVRQQCNEIAAFFPVDLALARRWVPPAFNLVVDAQGKAGGALIIMNCPTYFSLATPNAPPLEKPENTAPGSVVHLWFMLQGPAQILPVPYAEVTAPTQYAYAVADLVTSSVAARVYRRAGKNAILIAGATLVENGTRQTAKIAFTNGKSVTVEAYTPKQLPTPLRFGGNIWNWHAAAPAAAEDDLHLPASPTNINTTRVMFLATVPGAPNITQVTIHAEEGTPFAAYYGAGDFTASRATFMRPNNIVNNSSRGELTWRTYPPYELNSPPLLPK
jgi:hypothetical protein